MERSFDIFAICAMFFGLPMVVILTDKRPSAPGALIDTRRPDHNQYRNCQSQVMRESKELAFNLPPISREGEDREYMAAGGRH
jgi:hypothetical protein